jgi:acyl carrier protein
MTTAKPTAAPELTELTELAADAVAATLGVPASDVRSAPSLFDLPGFDSVAVVAVLDRLESALSVEVPAELILPEAFTSLDTVVRLLAEAVVSPGGQE